MCRTPSSLEIHNVTWIRNGTTVDLTTEDVEIVEYNLLKISNMNVSVHEYKCMVYKNSSDESPTTSSSLMVHNYYSKFLYQSLKRLYVLFEYIGIYNSYSILAAISCWKYYLF